MQGPRRTTQKRNCGIDKVRKDLRGSKEEILSIDFVLLKGPLEGNAEEILSIKKIEGYNRKNK